MLLRLVPSAGTFRSLLRKASGALTLAATLSTAAAPLGAQAAEAAAPVEAQPSQEARAPEASATDTAASPATAPGGGLSPGAPAGPAVQGSGEAAVAQALAEQESRLKTMAAELASLREHQRTREASDAAAAAPPQLAASGYLHFDWGLFRQTSEDQLHPSTGEPLNQDRFLLRRGRLRLSGHHGWLTGFVELDGNTLRGPTVRVLGVEASVRPPPAADAPPGELPLWMITAGQFRPPFGLELMQSGRERSFMERGAAVNALFPGHYDLGLRLQGAWRFARYHLALVSGSMVGDPRFPLRSPTAGKDVVGRVGVDTQVAGGVTVRGGFSFLLGQGLSPGRAATKDQLVWRDLNEDGQVQLGEIQIIPGQAATPSRPFGRSGLGADLRIAAPVPVLGELAVFGEVIRSVNLDRGFQVSDPLVAGRSLRQLGFAAGATLELGPHAQLGVRYDVYDPDGDLTENRGGRPVLRSNRVSTLAVSAIARLKGRARLILQYDLNRNNLGRTVEGAPTHLPDNALTLRTELQL